MRYLVTTKDNPPFLTEYFDVENHFAENLGMVVYDLCKKIYTKNGRMWFEIPKNSL